VPNSAETHGDFSKIPHSRPAAAGRPFPGNMIFATRLESGGLKVASFYPAPNMPNHPSANANYRRRDGDTVPYYSSKIAGVPRRTM
jgi:hypothetical protein